MILKETPRAKPVSQHDTGNGCFNALMLAVGHADEAMTAFLLANGANPHTWPNMDELPEELRINYYLEDIDVHYMDESKLNIIPIIRVYCSDKGAVVPLEIFCEED